MKIETYVTFKLVGWGDSESQVILDAEAAINRTKTRAHSVEDTLFYVTFKTLSRESSQHPDGREAGWGLHEETKVVIVSASSTAEVEDIVMDSYPNVVVSSIYSRKLNRDTIQPVPLP